jgi:aspartyl-tRNA synthetase
MAAGTRERKADVARFIDELKRTHGCGQLRASDIGQEVVLFGWIAHRRDFGGCIFIDLRDREGLTQIVFDTAYEPGEVARLASAAETPLWDEAEVAQAHALADEARREWVIGVRGIVIHRGDTNINEKLATGEIEIRVAEAVVFNRADTPPFSLEDNINTDEEIRLTYRYLDRKSVV